MKRFKIPVLALLVALMVLTPASAVFAREGQGQIGFWGGITEGVPLPMTTEQLILDATTGGRPDANITNMVYTEIIWLDGTPREFEGLMDMRVQNAGGRSANANFGTRTVSYNIRPSATTDEDLLLTRNVTFRVNWRRVGNQVIETYSVTRWTETVTIGGTVYTLDQSRSNHEVSIIRDITPGVTYYRGEISSRSVFTNDGTVVTHHVMGQIYGFASAWSAAETHRLHGMVEMANGSQVHYSIVPSVAVSKELQFSVSEPTLISFDGNYREVTTNQSGLNFVINARPNSMYWMPSSGRATIDSFNRFEQLRAPQLNHLRGHFAYQDIRRLFAMEIITVDPMHFRPDQAVTRAEFMTMLARAAKLPIDQAHRTPPAPPRNGRAQQVTLTFPDLWPNRPDYAYLRAINTAGIAVGRGDGHFHPDEIIFREEAYVLALRTLGLSNLGLEPVPLLIYVDNDAISYWALNDINAATRIGLIAPDNYGYLHPQSYLTKAQAAALINRLIEYMRHELMQDYTENIINFMN